MPERRTFLKASMLKKGVRATIDAQPYEEEKDFNDGNGLKTLFQIPLRMDVPVRDSYNNVDTTSVLWNCGINARRLLQETLGNNESTWINRAGHFDAIPWSTEKRSGFAWALIPEPVVNFQAPIIQPSSSILPNPSSIQSPTSVNSTTEPIPLSTTEPVTALTPQKAPTSVNRSTEPIPPSVTPFDCPECLTMGKRYMTDDPKEYAEHLLKKHPKSTKASVKSTGKKVQ